MNNLAYWIIIIILSVVLGVIKYFYAIEPERRKGVIFVFNEIWNQTIGIFLGGVIIYYLISIRFPLIAEQRSIDAIDLILLFVVVMSLLGWTPYLIKNFTEGIYKLIKSKF